MIKGAHGYAHATALAKPDEARYDHPDDYLRVVFDCGRLVVDENFEDIKERVK